MAPGPTQQLHTREYLSCTFQPSPNQLLPHGTRPERQALTFTFFPQTPPEATTPNWLHQRFHGKRAGLDTDGFAAPALPWLSLRSPEATHLPAGAG